MEMRHWLFSGNGPAPFAAIALLLASDVFAAELLVSNNNDSGDGSLRQAIIGNNTLGGGNTIIFSNIVTGTITLTSGELLISRTVSILGPGPKNLAVDGNGSSRVFHVTVPGDGAALISGLTITNGVATNSPPSYAGGGIWNDHSIMRVDNCTLVGNSANTFGGGAIYNDGSLSGSATLVVYSCTFSGNYSGTVGGGIANNGYQGGAGLLIRTSTFTGNTALTAGGGIHSDAFQGAATVAVNASTFSSNSVAGFAESNGGGIYNHGLFGNATLFVNGSTFSRNSAMSGGAIFNNSPTGNARLEIGDSILLAGASGGTIANDLGTVISRGYNLSSDASAGFLTNATDRINLDPLLGPLADNGGVTFTHALLAGSPAIDQGRRDIFPIYPLEIMTADQRGAPRPFDFSSLTNAPGGDGSDIGAFELGRPSLNIQQVANSAVLSWPSYYGDFTLQSSTNVTASNSWITAEGSAAVVGNEYRQTNGPISSNRFFRLRGN